MRCLAIIGDSFYLRKTLLFKSLFFACLATFLLWHHWRGAKHVARVLLQSDYRQCLNRRNQNVLQKSTSPLFATLTRHGRLGNWMYGYASLLGVAHANGYTPYFTKEHPLNHYFNISHTQQTDAQCLNTVYDDRPCSYNPDFLNLPYGNVSIEGYIQSWKYFRLIQQDIHREFKLRDHIQYRVDDLFSNLVGSFVKEKRSVISIHIRRGDVLKPEARKLGFCHAPKIYFDRAMKYMLEKFPHSVFLVLSNDIEWCKDNIKPPKVGGESVPLVFSPGYSMGIDFGLLTKCDHSIISVGTFGWWGAWLTHGHVVYFGDFPLPGTKLDYEMAKEDYYPDEWIAISKSCGLLPSTFKLILVFFFSLHMYAPLI